MSVTSTLCGSGLSTYLSNLLTHAQQAKTGAATTTTTTTTTATKTQASSGAAAITPNAKSLIAQAALDTRQHALATAMQAALTKAKTPLGGSVQFSVDASGALSVNGNAADCSSLAAVLKADKTYPSMASRLATLGKDAQALATSMRQQSNIMRAARSAANPSQVMDLYTSLQQQAPSGATAVLSVSQTSSSLLYPGVLQTKA
jgi:hypothetical protein